MSEQETKVKPIEGASFTALLLQRKGEAIPWETVLDAAAGHVNKEILDSAIPPNDEPYMLIQMPCGNHLRFETPADLYELIPGLDMPCPCGNPNHYWVRWIEIEAS